MVPAARAKPIVAGVVIPITSFWLYTEFLELADYDRGKERLLGVVLGTVAVFLLPQAVARTHPNVRTALLVVAWILFAARMFEVGLVIAEGEGPAIDVGRTTIAAVDVVLEGGNPYTSRLDELGYSFNPEGQGWDYFGGFKYGPAMIWAYMPAVVLFDGGGYLAMNFLALVGAGLAGYWWASRDDDGVAGVGCFCLVLTGVLAGELFELGVNDIMPTAIAIAAFAFRARGFPVTAGAVLGLSFAAKPVPALLLVLPLLLLVESSRIRFALAALGVGLGFYLPWAILSPQELVANLVVFNLERTVNSTALLYYLPSFLKIPVVVIGLAAVIAVPVIYMRKARQRGVAEVASVACVAMVFFFAASPGLHRNYLVWFLPFLAIALGARLWGGPYPSEALEGGEPTARAT